MAPKHNHTMALYKLGLVKEAMIHNLEFMPFLRTVTFTTTVRSEGMMACYRYIK